ncbi:hypothetical protein CDL12_21507 [Handroanthus impetiginosus]|uniref:Uncharacterized protein n=1 Tax=Handroanthus impetiginosus TaxID=429701 RepID=A0A2G9GLR2_9LAMI|nr:hypothetical protein CDL12_21507 [Handroanthus impetiginosus]
MELEKRKRRDDGESNGKREKPMEDDDVKKVEPQAPPGDEEVDEFFAILKRIKVAVRYFQRRDSISCTDGELAAKPSWIPSFEREDFDDARKDPESKNRNEGLDGSSKKKNEGLDLNRCPAPDG